MENETQEPVVPQEVIPEEIPETAPVEPTVAPEETAPEVQTSEEVVPEENDGIPPKSYVNQDGATMADDYRIQ